MKRSKFIAGALILSMGLLGTGYAYWSDTLQVNATVSTGTMDVDINVAEAIKTKDTDQSIFNVTTVTNTSPVGSEGEASTDDEITFTISNLYPTAEMLQGTLKIGAISRGTIPVKIDTQGVTITGQCDSNIKFVIENKEYTVDTQENKNAFASAIQTKLIGDGTWTTNQNGVVEIGVKIVADNSSQGVSGTFEVNIPWIQAIQ